MGSKISKKVILHYYKIMESVNANKTNFKSLQIVCYLCHIEGHISIHCNQFEKTIKGNLIKYYNKVSKSPF